MRQQYLCYPCVAHVFPYSAREKKGREFDVFADSWKAVTARPGARFGPTGVRQGSRRMSPSWAWSVYNGEASSYHLLSSKLTGMPGENPFTSWAKVLDCGDAPLTFLDNSIALKQLEKAHKVNSSITSCHQKSNDRKCATKRCESSMLTLHLHDQRSCLVERRRQRKSP